MLTNQDRVSQIVVRFLFELDQQQSQQMYSQMLKFVDTNFCGKSPVNLDSVMGRLGFEDFQNATPLVGQSLISTFNYEQKMGLAHCKILPNQTNAKFTFNCYTQAVVRVGFRRLYTIPTCYQMISQNRGKLLRWFNNDSEMMAFFPCPLCVTKSNYPPVILKYSQQYNLQEFIDRGDQQAKIENQSEILHSQASDEQITLRAKLALFNSQMQLIERLVLTGWPYKIHRNRSLIRYMFFNQQDVKYFINQYL